MTWKMNCSEGIIAGKTYCLISLIFSDISSGLSAVLNQGVVMRI